MLFWQTVIWWDVSMTSKTILGKNRFWGYLRDGNLILLFQNCQVPPMKILNRVISATYQWRVVIYEVRRGTGYIDFKMSGIGRRNARHSYGRSQKRLIIVLYVSIKNSIAHTSWMFSSCFSCLIQISWII